MIKPGQRVIIKGEHPWEGEVGELVKYEKYGLSFLKLEGWLVQLDNGTDCYAKNSEVKAI